MTPKGETAEEKKARITSTKKRIEDSVINMIGSHRLGSYIRITSIFYRKGAFNLNMVYQKTRRSKKFTFGFSDESETRLIQKASEALTVIEVHGK